MDTYEVIEELMAQRFGKAMKVTRKATGDFMLADDHAVNVKSNNVEKANYSPNMISIKKLHEWVFEQGNKLSFVFVDYKVVDGQVQVLNEPTLVPVEHISWDCLSIEAQGYGVIQKVAALVVLPNQTKRQFYQGFLAEYERYMEKERRKHARFSGKFIANLDELGPSKIE